jgi:hypothetical protein
MWLVIDHRDGSWQAFNLSRVPKVAWLLDDSGDGRLLIRTGDGDWTTIWPKTDNPIYHIHVLSDESAAGLIARRIRVLLDSPNLDIETPEVKRHD